MKLLSLATLLLTVASSTAIEELTPKTFAEFKSSGE